MRRDDRLEWGDFGCWSRAVRLKADPTYAMKRRGDIPETDGDSNLRPRNGPVVASAPPATSEERTHDQEAAC